MRNQEDVLRALKREVGLQKAFQYTYPGGVTELRLTCRAGGKSRTMSIGGWMLESKSQIELLRAEIDKIKRNEYAKPRMMRFNDDPPNEIPILRSDEELTTEEVAQKTEILKVRQKELAGSTSAWEHLRELRSLFDSRDFNIQPPISSVGRLGRTGSKKRPVMVQEEDYPRLIDLMKDVYDGGTRGEAVFLEASKRAKRKWKELKLIVRNYSPGALKGIWKRSRETFKNKISLGTYPVRTRGGRFKAES